MGVSLQQDFNYNTAFCDFKFGFAYYGTGQLRNGCNSQGPQYGNKTRNQGVIGVCLNMNKGTLSFAQNGVSWGVAFANPSLKSGPIFPAVSLLHCAGCELRSEAMMPACFK
eukprot:TRINITY_DN11807_c0_g1_i1.p4 TRINITY_DN11807_c0_g1~~TRINITY_DN11807_c0_g1_i1.p4  ORF type:complete len:111 (-),score=17.58 TRINITY_DN11807_c0_g1_i1:65-397(-)